MERFYLQTLIIYKLGFNENYYTFTLILLIQIMLSSKIHCQKGFKLKLISYKIVHHGGLVSPPQEFREGLWFIIQGSTPGIWGSFRTCVYQKMP